MGKLQNRSSENAQAPQSTIKQVSEIYICSQFVVCDA